MLAKIKKVWKWKERRSLVGSTSAEPLTQQQTAMLAVHHLVIIILARKTKRHKRHKGKDTNSIPHICHKHHKRCLCKNFLSGVIFSRLSEKKLHTFDFPETFLVFLVSLVVFLGVKFGFRKSCLCKRNDKYGV